MMNVLYEKSEKWFLNEKKMKNCSITTYLHILPINDEDD